MEYRGIVISREGVHVDNSKIPTILEWPTPTNVKQLRGLLGLTGYYRKFVKHYADIAFPLTELKINSMPGMMKHSVCLSY